MERVLGTQDTRSLWIREHPAYWSNKTYGSLRQPTSSATFAPSSIRASPPKAGYAHYMVRQAAEDWLAHGLEDRSPKTVKKNQNVLQPILDVIGARKLRDLSAADVRQALAAGYSTAAVSMGHLALKRTIRHAEAGDLISRNVAALADTPKGQPGRPPNP